VALKFRVLPPERSGIKLPILCTERSRSHVFSSHV